MVIEMKKAVLRTQMITVYELKTIAYVGLN